MSQEKTFPLKLSSSKHTALKEQTHKHTSGEQVKIKVEYTLDSELRLVEPQILVKGEYVSIQESAGRKGLSVEDFLIECREANQPIYYPLINTTYVCMQNITMSRGQVIKNTLSLYIPTKLDNNKIICKDVSITFPRQSRNILADKYLEFALSRIK